MEHTPGSWQALQAAAQEALAVLDEEFGQCGCVPDRPDGPAVTCINCRLRAAIAGATASARLIAAAPALLVAAQEALILLDEFTMPEEDEPMRDAAGILRAAIAQATSEE